ncbi:MAG TPA: PEP-CTERM sorting domain-containing protein [Myxococcota bacterium]|nr:PEP-CTERM sorting domain-containing protein [Myxococcota bacterium]
MRRRTRGVALGLGLLRFALPGAAAADVFASPDVMVSLSGAPVRDREAAIDDGMGSILIENFGGLPDGADVDALDQEVGRPLRFSLDVTAQLPGGVVATPDDVVRMDAGVYTLDFDGAAYGVRAGTNLDALARLPDGSLLLSFDVAVELGGVRADDEDLLRFAGGVFTLYFDASSNGVAPELDLDAAAYAGEGRIAVSFDGAGTLGGVHFQDEDVITLQPGEGGVKLFFDGSAAHAGWADADLDAVAIPEPGVLAGLASGAALLAGLARRRTSRR